MSFVNTFSSYFVIHMHAYFIFYMFISYFLSPNFTSLIVQIQYSYGIGNIYSAFLWCGYLYQMKKQMLFQSMTSYTNERDLETVFQSEV